jgi:ABC-type nitrate/sulfonate/bicarbonate transport system ATPase subunit
VLQEELRRITAQYTMTVLFVTHDVAEAVFLGNVIFVMSGRPGRILRTIEPSAEERDRASGKFAHLTAEIFGLLAHPQPPAADFGASA